MVLSVGGVVGGVVDGGIVVVDGGGIVVEGGMVEGSLVVGAGDSVGVEVSGDIDSSVVRQADSASTAAESRRAERVEVFMTICPDGAPGRPSVRPRG